MTQEALLPCPFCGEQPIWYHSANGVAAAVHCETPECAAVPSVRGKDLDAAQHAWNRRASLGETQGPASQRYRVVYDERGQPWLWRGTVAPDTASAVSGPATLWETVGTEPIEVEGGPASQPQTEGEPRGYERGCCCDACSAWTAKRALLAAAPSRQETASEPLLACSCGEVLHNCARCVSEEAAKVADEHARKHERLEFSECGAFGFRRDMQAATARCIASDIRALHRPRGPAPRVTSSPVSPSVQESEPRLVCTCGWVDDRRYEFCDLHHPKKYLSDRQLTEAEKTHALSLAAPSVSLPASLDAPHAMCGECHAGLKVGSPASRIGFCSGCLGLISEGRFAEAVAAASRVPSLGSLPVEERDLLEEAAKVADEAAAFWEPADRRSGHSAHVARKIAADIRALRVTSGEGTT